MKTRLEQQITLKALRFKYDDSDIFLDSFLGENVDSEQVKTHFKNVCALISRPMCDRLEKTLEVLNMSKREFLGLAISDALDKADVIMKDINVMEFHRPDDGKAA